jgi:hypothetical protein
MAKVKSFVLRVLVGVVLLAHVGMAGVFVFHELLGFTSSNAALYVLRGRQGGIELSRDLLLEEADRLIFMLDANCLFNWFMRGLAMARGKPVMELTWDRARGVGDVKQFRPDGTILSLTFSRYLEDAGRPQGLFIGGDLPYGDIARDEDSDTSGFGYYDGQGWKHIWCALNEGFHVKGTGQTLVPPFWKYTGSRVLKNSMQEVMLESTHEALVEGQKIIMRRYVLFRAGQDYFVLRVKFTNASPKPLVYGYAIGDEPWVGSFGASRGDVGYYEAGLVQYEKFISPRRHSWAGFWDIGNPALGEQGPFTGYANFVQWFQPAPTYVFFSNSLDDCCSELTPLQSPVDRVINIVWLEQLLMPGQSREHVLAFGMARYDGRSPLPVKPRVSLN